MLGGAIAAILSLRSWISNRNYSALLTVSLLGGWGFLYILHKLPFDQSRHTLMLLPPFCLLLFWSMRPLVLRVPAFVMIAASIAMTISISVAGYSNAKEAFGPRKAMLTKQTIEKHAPDFVLTYGFTLGPIVDFYDSDVQAINLDLRSSLYFDWKAIDDSKRIMLVSQTKPMTETQLEGLRKRFPDLFEQSKPRDDFREQHRRLLSVSLLPAQLQPEWCLHLSSIQIDEVSPIQGLPVLFRVPVQQFFDLHCGEAS